MSAPDDSWGLPTPSPATRPPPKAPPRVVKDSWDDSSDEEDSTDHKQLWDNANKQERMPEIVATSNTVAPPIAALTGPMRILKRPTAGSTPSPAPSRPASSKPLQEREADYAAARERIFGKDASSAEGKRPPSKPQQNVARQPRGPPTAGGAAAAGFSARQRPAPQRSNSGSATPSPKPNSKAVVPVSEPSALPEDDAPPPAAT
ncbi:hypothetical protein EXIGLDRAFT_830775 [Exidia glandulosa HHB12029]|uniref:SUZ domain-containing protein n=1 Tax=Exidia glandulosa HHB12029 TaxID=1314781 RepID=A0A165N8B5_EXIGL|nr:hypothetical protein EXIGLDRAFT_830775 [Exidia glandulosa HHB12029]